MPPKNRLSREEKDFCNDPVVDVTANGSPLDDFNLMHHDAMRDTDNMALAKRE